MELISVFLSPFLDNELSVLSLYMWDYKTEPDIKPVKFTGGGDHEDNDYDRNDQG